MSRVLLLFGATGMLGTAVRWRFEQSGWTVRTVARESFDILTNDLMHLDISGVDAVINAAGLTNRWLGKLGRSDFLLTNALFPRLLADRCEISGIPFVHISTDCVFDGEAGRYIESSRPNAVDIYGRSKRFGEPSNAMVLRTSIIGPESKNFYSLLCWSLGSKKITGFTNHLWNGVVTTELARCIEGILTNDGFQHGIFHVFGEDITKFDLLRLIADVYGSTVKIDAGRAAIDKDMRLATSNDGFIEKLHVRSLAEQLREAAGLSDGCGHWIGRLNG